MVHGMMMADKLTVVQLSMINKGVMMVYGGFILIIMVWIIMLHYQAKDDSISLYI